MNGKIMETALVREAAKREITLSEINNKENILQSIPFNPQQKFSVSLVKEGEKYFLVFLSYYLLMR